MLGIRAISVLALIGAAAGGELGAQDVRLVSPHGKLLTSSRLTLRWTSSESGPFRVEVLDEGGDVVYAASTYGHELRVLVGPGEGELASGRTYHWHVTPESSHGGATAPSAQFRLLTAAESQAAHSRYGAAARKLGVEDETKEPGSRIALAELYLEEGFYVEAERELERLVERGWDDPRIDALLTKARKGPAGGR